jgi:NADPH:quinone reductase-like Zn-dependent oxidoreductase
VQLNGGGVRRRCGTAGIQIARKLGAAEIVAVCSAGNFPLVQGLGATRCADYGDAQAYDALVDGSRFDVVFDCATGSGSGENYDADARKMLAPGGKRVALSGSKSPVFSAQRPVQPAPHSRAQRPVKTRHAQPLCNG